MSDPALTQYFIMFFEKIFLTTCTIEHKFIDTWKSFKDLLIKSPVDMNDIHNFVSELYGLKFPIKDMQIIYEQPEVNRDSDNFSKANSEETLQLPEVLDKKNLKFVPSLNLKILSDCSNLPNNRSRKGSEKESNLSSIIKESTMRDSIGKIPLKIFSPQRKNPKKNLSRFTNPVHMTPNDRYIRDSTSFWEEIDEQSSNNLVESPILLKMKKFELDSSITSARNIFKFERPVHFHSNLEKIFPSFRIFAKLH